MAKDDTRTDPQAEAREKARDEAREADKKINDLIEKVAEAMVEAGTPRTQADALLYGARRRGEPDIRGNIADLQRMGAIVVEGEIPADSMPPGQEQKVVESSDIQEAFAEPPREEGPNINDDRNAWGRVDPNLPDPPEEKDKVVVTDPTSQSPEAEGADGGRKAKATN